MPSYTVDVATEPGAERHQFTLDDDRPLRPQVTQILEELRQRGVILRGTHDDELGVFWQGRALDVERSPSELGISPAHAVELRMRARPAAAAPPPPPSLPRGILASVGLGHAGAVVAWILTGFWSDTGALVPSYVRLDQLTMLLLGALAGASILAGAALRTRGSVVLGFCAGFVLGGAGAVAGSSIAVALPWSGSVRAFIVVRIAGWALAGGLAALLLAAFAAKPDARRLVESAGLGLLAGAAAGVAFSLPGPSELWQAIAFAILGAGLGVAVAGPALWRAAAIVELSTDRGVPNVATLREWAVHEGTAASIGGARVACHEGRVALYPAPGGTAVAGRPVTEPVYLTEHATVTVGAERMDVRLGAAR